MLVQLPQDVYELGRGYVELVHGHLNFELHCEVCCRRYPVSVCRRYPELAQLLQQRIADRALADPLDVHALAVELIVETKLAKRGSQKESG